MQRTKVKLKVLEAEHELTSPPVGLGANCQDLECEDPRAGNRELIKDCYWSCSVCRQGECLRWVFSKGVVEKQRRGTAKRGA